MLWRRNDTEGRWDSDANYCSILSNSTGTASGAKHAAAGPPCSSQTSANAQAQALQQSGTTADGIAGGDSSSELSEADFEERLRACMVQVGF